MTAPAARIRADAPLTNAICEPTSGQLSRLCVVDAAGRLVGVVIRGDILQVFLRSDAALENDIERQVIGSAREPHAVTVRVTDGIAVLDGRLRLRSMVDRAGQLASGIPVSWPCATTSPSRSTT